MIFKNGIYFKNILAGHKGLVGSSIVQKLEELDFRDKI
ncbi:hypothetical protein B4065_1643 [Caldibacillus thermoamylovorans]|nr:hypothetical protein B4065_1643 [Caldibacillus thermoamylovorans]